VAHDLFREFVTPDDVVVEIGAGDGKDPLTLSKLSRQVYVFEPNPYAFSRVKHMVRRKRNVQLFNLGAGAKEETVKLRLPELANQPYGSRSAPAQLTRLDRVEFGLPPTCLVLDCGGSELEALKGAEALISSGTLRTILLKTHQLTDERDTGREAILWLLDHGFRTESKKALGGSLWVIARAFRTKPQTKPAPH